MTERFRCESQDRFTVVLQIVELTVLPLPDGEALDAFNLCIVKIKRFLKISPVDLALSQDNNTGRVGHQSIFQLFVCHKIFVILTQTPNATAKFAPRAITGNHHLPSKLGLKQPFSFIDN